MMNKMNITGNMNFTVPIRGGRFNKDELYKFAYGILQLIGLKTNDSDIGKYPIIKEIHDIAENAHTFTHTNWYACYIFSKDERKVYLHNQLSYENMIKCLEESNNYIAFYPIFTDKSKNPGTICGVTAKVSFS